MKFSNRTTIDGKFMGKKLGILGALHDPRTGIVRAFSFVNRSGRGEREGRGADGTAIRPRIYAFRADKWPGHGHGDVSDSQQAIRSARLFCIIRIVYARGTVAGPAEISRLGCFQCEEGGGGPHSLRASTSASSLFRLGHPIECRGTPALSEGGRPRR